MKVRDAIEILSEMPPDAVLVLPPVVGRYRRVKSITKRKAEDARLYRDHDDRALFTYEGTGKKYDVASPIVDVVVLGE